MDVEGQLLVPHWVRAHADLTAGHHFTEKLAAMEKTCLDYQLSEGKKKQKNNRDQNITVGSRKCLQVFRTNGKTETTVEEMSDMVWLKMNE